MKMSKPVIFLDIDGVLNGHNYNHNCESSTIDSLCMNNLNYILRSTNACIIISSAWRYMIHNNAITLKGFNYLMRTHGMIVARDGSGNVLDRIIGFTCMDEQIKDRGDQITHFLNGNEKDKDFSYVVLDDATPPPDNPDDHSMSQSLIKNHSGRFIRVHGNIGLTRKNADDAIAILKIIGDIHNPKSYVYDKDYIFK